MLKNMNNVAEYTFTRNICCFYFSKHSVHLTKKLLKLRRIYYHTFKNLVLEKEGNRC